MDKSIELILTNMASDMKRMRDDTKDSAKNILYLCQKSACTDVRLGNIEKNMEINDKETDLAGKQISKIEGKLIGLSAFIAITISTLINIFI